MTTTSTIQLTVDVHLKLKHPKFRTHRHTLIANAVPLGLLPASMQGLLNNRNALTASSMAANRTVGSKLGKAMEWNPYYLPVLLIDVVLQSLAGTDRNRVRQTTVPRLAQR